MIKLRPITDLRTPIGEILKAAEASGVVIHADDQEQYAFLPLDDELLDFLLERNPRFIKECEQIRQEMMLGKSHSQDEVEHLFAKSDSKIE
jgi:hypothetical protein